MKVWLAWSEFYEDSHVVKVFDTEDKANEWKRQCDKLKLNYTEDDWDKSFKHAHKDKEKWQKLGMAYNDWCHYFTIEECEVD